jgi:raw score 10.55
MTKHIELFNNTWNVRISDPGEEGAQSHFFETVYLILTAHLEETIRYEFVRRVEDQVKIKRDFTDLQELFKFLGDYLDPVSLGLLGVKIGNLGVTVE